MPWVQVESDLHLEFRDPDVPLAKFLPKKRRADWLVLAGDICPVATHRPVLERLLAYCHATWPRTFLVAGNHEYYHNDGPPTQTDEALRAAAGAFDNVHFLQRESIRVDGVDVHGCTLWSRTARPLAGVADYRAVRATESTLMTHLDSLAWHEADVAFLEDRLAAAGRGPTLVITHHMPSRLLVAQRFRDDETTDAFASDLDHVAARAHVWICGHSHAPADVMIGQCRAVMNPRGYPNETVYRPKLVSIP